MRPAAGHYFSISGYSKFCCLSGNIYMIRKSATGAIVALAVIWVVAHGTQVRKFSQVSKSLLKILTMLKRKVNMPTT